MIDIKDFIETENINKTVLSDSLGITRTTLYTWLEEKRPEKIEKIIKAINQLAADLTNKIKEAGMENVTISQSNGSVQIAGLREGSSVYLDSAKEIENLKLRLSMLKEMIKSKDDQISLLKELLSKERGSK